MKETLDFYRSRWYWAKKFAGRRKGAKLFLKAYWADLQEFLASYYDMTHMH